MAQASTQHGGWHRRASFCTLRLFLPQCSLGQTLHSRQPSYRVVLLFKGVVGDKSMDPASFAAGRVALHQSCSGILTGGHCQLPGHPFPFQKCIYLLRRKVLSSDKDSRVPHKEPEAPWCWPTGLFVVDPEQGRSRQGRSCDKE